jgi:hemerythrin-like domain-containing protein
MKSISAVQLLRDDHKKILGLFRQLEVLSERAPEMRDAVVMELFEEFLIHSQIEERLFYPGVERLIENKFPNKVEVNESGIIDKSYSDHQEVAVLIQRYSRERVVGQVRDGSKIEEMSGLVQAHMIEEEKSLFPFVEKNFADSLEDLGKAMIALREDLIRANKIPDASKPNHAQNMDGGEQRRIA